AVAVQTSAPGSQLDSGNMWEVSRMKYDLNAHAEMGNITLEEHLSKVPDAIGEHLPTGVGYEDDLSRPQ
ncbi:hypothetical protein NQZ68_031311, partial [Dissostichus eleginoides]